MPLLIFSATLLGALGVAMWRQWPLAIAMIDAVGYATALTLLIFGDQLSLPYQVKALGVALGAVATTWAFGHMRALQRTGAGADN